MRRYFHATPFQLSLQHATMTPVTIQTRMSSTDTGSWGCVQSPAKSTSPGLSQLARITWVFAMGDMHARAAFLRLTRSRSPCVIFSWNATRSWSRARARYISFMVSNCLWITTRRPEYTGVRRKSTSTPCDPMLICRILVLTRHINSYVVQGGRELSMLYDCTLIT